MSNDTSKSEDIIVEAQLCQRMDKCKDTEEEDCNNTVCGRCAVAIGCSTKAFGDCSTAEGSGTTAIGNSSHSEGNSTKANGDNSHSEGCSTVTYGSCSHAEGANTLAYADYSHTEGYNTKTRGIRAHAEGIYAEANGEGAHAAGYNSKAEGFCSAAEGYYTSAQNSYSHAEGNYTQAKGYSSHAEGYYSSTELDYSHAEGYRTDTNGYYSHTEGYYSKTYGSAAHAEGYNTLAGGTSSHAEGYYTEANAAYSHAEGYRTRTGNAVGANIMGIYGDADTPYSWFLGGGTSDSDRSLAAKILYTGDAYIKNAWNAGGAGYAELFRSECQAIEAGYFVTLREDKIELVNCTEEYVLGVTAATPGFVANSMELARCVAAVNSVKPSSNTVTKNIIPQTKDPEGKILIEEQVDQVPLPASDADNSKSSIQYIDTMNYWTAVVLLGQVVVYDDGTCKPNHYCMPNENGVATMSPRGYRVMKRLCENKILIMFR